MKKIIVLALLSLYGCSPMEIREEFFGMSVYNMEKAKQKYTKVFMENASDCYGRSLSALTEMGAQICREARGSYFITAYGFNKMIKCVDTTEVGIMVVPLEKDKCEVVVASGNYDLGEFVSEKLFKKLGSEK